MTADAVARLRSVFTNEVIRAVGALVRQQNVCREQAGQVVFVTGMEAAREYISEQFAVAHAQDQGWLQPDEKQLLIALLDEAERHAGDKAVEVRHQHLRAQWAHQVHMIHRIREHIVGAL